LEIPFSIEKENDEAEQYLNIFFPSTFDFESADLQTGDFSDNCELFSELLAGCPLSRKIEYVGSEDSYTSTTLILQFELKNPVNITILSSI
jgi:hypothetical protein